MSNNQKIADIMDKLIAGKLAEANVEQIAEFSEYARRKLEIAERLADKVLWIQRDFLYKAPEQITPAFVEQRYLKPLIEIAAEFKAALRQSSGSTTEGAEATRMTETEEALATALADGFNNIQEPDQLKFTAEGFEMHARFIVPTVERLIALREAEVRLEQFFLAHLHYHEAKPDAADEHCLRCGYSFRDTRMHYKSNDGRMYENVRPWPIRVKELERQRDALLKQRTP